jgi:hypothetical protein
MTMFNLTRKEPASERSQLETVFTVKEIADEWKLSVDTVQRLFKDEPDVFVAKGRRKKMLRIPSSVKERVWRRHLNTRAA